MCKNADKPCPGCKTHGKADPARMFLTDEERQAPEKSSEAPSFVYVPS